MNGETAPCRRQPGLNAIRCRTRSPCHGIVVLLLLGVALCAAAVTAETHRFTSLNQTIPDGNPSGLRDVRIVSSEIGNLSTVRVRLRIAGDYNGDLCAYVRHAHPADTNRCVLLNRPGRTSSDLLGYSDGGLDVLFDDSAASGNVHSYRSVTNVPSGFPLSGLWQPDGRTTDPGDVLESHAPTTTLDSFAGADASGEWTLFVADMDSGGTNWLLGWELELTGDTTPEPILEATPDQLAYVLMSLVVTNRVVNSNRLSGPLRFGLGAGTPANAWMDPIEGVFYWEPTREQARSVNRMSVWVSDSSLPPLSATNTFTVTVEDYVAVDFGQVVMRAGQTSSLPVTLMTSTGLTNVQALVVVPEGRLTDPALIQWEPEVGHATLQQQAPNAWQIEFAAASSEGLQGTQRLAWLQFTAVSNRSAFVPLVASDITSFQTNGLGVWRTLSSPGRGVIIDQESLLEALPPTNNQPRLVLYGVPGHDYDILASPVLPALSGWLPVWQGTMPTNLWMAVEGLTNTITGPAIFYRAKDTGGQ